MRSIFEKRQLKGEPITKEELKGMLADGPVDFEFVKLDGERREATGTRDMDYVPEESHPKGVKTVTNQIPFYDLEEDDWRSVSMKTYDIALPAEDDVDPTEPPTVIVTEKPDGDGSERQPGRDRDGQQQYDQPHIPTDLDIMGGGEEPNQSMDVPTVEKPSSVFIDDEVDDSLYPSDSPTSDDPRSNLFMGDDNDKESFTNPTYDEYTDDLFISDTNTHQTEKPDFFISGDNDVDSLSFGDSDDKEPDSPNYDKYDDLNLVTDVPVPELDYVEDEIDHTPEVGKDYDHQDVIIDVEGIGDDSYDSAREEHSGEEYDDLDQHAEYPDYEEGDGGDDSDHNTDPELYINVDEFDGVGEREPISDSNDANDEDSETELESTKSRSSDDSEIYLDLNVK